MQNEHDIHAKDTQIALLLEALSQAAQRERVLIAENAKLSQDFSELAAKSEQRIHDLESQIAEALATIDSLIEQIKLANQHFFGSRSERVIPEQLSLFNDVEATATPDEAEPDIDEVLPRKPRKRGGKPVIDYDRLETIVIEHEIPEDERACPECGCVLKEAKVEVTRRVRLVPAHLVVEEHRQHVYCCRECSSNNAKGDTCKSRFVRASAPDPFIPGSFATPSLVAYILNGKYINSLPLYRMEAELTSLGANISRQNMANWVMNVHERWLSSLYERMKAELLSHDLAHADETVVQVLKEPNREPETKSRMWLFCSAECDVPVYIFEYHTTRRKSIPQAFFEGWSGTLTTDGYKPYFNLGIEGMSNTACLVHVRRYFARIVKAAGGDAKCSGADAVALEARRRIDKMFRVDSEFDNMSPDERKIARDKKLKPLMESFEAWAQMKQPATTPRLALRRAFDYALTYWPYVKNVLNDGRLVLSNNRAEQAISAFVIGRKNWLFSNTPRGAHASAAMYSIMLTAKANKLNPRRYIEWVLTEMPKARRLTDEVVDRFLPWSEEVPQDCRIPEKEAKTACQIIDRPIVDADRELLDDEMINNEKE